MFAFWFISTILLSFSLLYSSAETPREGFDSIKPSWGRASEESENKLRPGKSFSLPYPSHVFPHLIFFFHTNFLIFVHATKKKKIKLRMNKCLVFFLFL